MLAYLILLIYLYVLSKYLILCTSVLFSFTKSNEWI